MPRGFAVEVRTAEAGDALRDRVFRGQTIDFVVCQPPLRLAGRKPARQWYGRRRTYAARACARLIVIKGKTEHPEYLLEKPRTNIGRLAELTDADQRVVRRNDIVFEEGADEANSTVSRQHAHIRLRRLAITASATTAANSARASSATAARSMSPPDNRRGEKLRPGDEIYLGRACLRFEQ